MKSPLRFFATRLVSIGASVLLGLALNLAVPSPAYAQKNFKTPEEAMTAFGNAVTQSDEAALRTLLGANFRELIPPAGTEIRNRFLTAWDTSHAIQETDSERADIAVGNDGWTLPVPLVKSAKGWHFDTLAGVEEMRLRRIGRNELAVMQTMLAIYDAQREYAETDHDGSGVLAYAKKLKSSPGKRDGHLVLSWSCNGVASVDRSVPRAPETFRAGVPALSIRHPAPGRRSTRPSCAFETRVCDSCCHTSWRSVNSGRSRNPCRNARHRTRLQSLSGCATVLHGVAHVTHPCHTFDQEVLQLQVTGEMLIGRSAVRGSAGTQRALNPALKEEMEPAFGLATQDLIAQACELAGAAFDSYRLSAPEVRAAFLEAIGKNIVALGDTLVERVMSETGLPRARIEGERARTVGQLNLFASVVRAGRWRQATLDSALPERKPLARADLRKQHIPVGPVAVFGASNFPLAFSVAGGDTASALAAGCPVVVKAHPAHLGTSELVGRAIQQAVADAGLHEGVFSLIYGEGNAVGEALVSHPAIRSVGFTGSRAGGMALVRLAAQRPEPIPVFAEMSSVNPVFVLPGALKARAEDFAAQLVESLTMGAGQFCTNPGLIIALEGDDFSRLRNALTQASKGSRFIAAYRRSDAASPPRPRPVPRSRRSSRPMRAPSSRPRISSRKSSARRRC
jgi:hypothetical protein